MTQNTSWIAVDWGNTNLRVWALGEAGVIGHDSAPLGVSRVGTLGFEAALMSLIEPYLSDETETPVVCAGAIGSREGWAQTPYVSTPCTPPGGARAVSVPCHDDRIKVSILPGVSQASPPDVMRGEETQVAGVLALFKDFDGVICLPGTQTKWVHVSAGEIVSFQSFMTGDLFRALSEHSLLRLSVSRNETLDDEVFLSAVEEAMTRPQAFAAQLVGLSAADLLQGQSPDIARARLSGLLIGVELAAARPYWLGQRIVLVGAEGLAAQYRAALERQGLDVETTDVNAVTLAGLVMAKTTL
ncbi:MAG: 2-dehydro-3-deoxygalactonokinase [Maritimibacter sp.]